MSAKAKWATVVVLLALLAILIVQNRGMVVFRVFVWTIEMSQVILVALVALAGFVVGLFAGALARRRRRF